MSSMGPRPPVWLALFLLAVPGPLTAQYFGRNMVQYERFDFRRHATAHFDLYAYSSADAGARDAARLVERWYERHARTFQWEFLQRKPFLLYADQPDFQQSTLGEGSLTEGTGGFTEPVKDRVVLPMTGSLADDDHVIGHELVHSFQFDIVKSTRGGGIRGIGALPLWLVEGMAEYLSLGRQDAHTAMWLRDAVLRNDFPTLKQLSTDSRYFPYRYGQGLTAYIAGRWGTDVLMELFREASRRGLEPALQEVLGMPGESLVEGWRGAMEAGSWPLMQARTRPEDVGRRVLGSDEEERPLYIAPVVSPDGRYFAFFSARDLFSIDLYLAELESGRVVGRLASAATDPHMDALRFVESSGSWSPDGTRFAYVAYAGGDNEIVVADVESRRTLRRYATPGVGSIQNVSWSPDDERIAFSGTVGGIGDLFVLNVTTGSLDQLTRDRYSNLQPTWSPDGRTIAYVTDEGDDAELDRLSVGRPRIALLDLVTGRHRFVRPFEGAKHINPQFSPDGMRLFFVSDPEGFSDIFVLDLRSGQLLALTHVATGVSGITAAAPALSVAAGSGDVLFSVFSRAGYYVHALPGDAPGVAVTPPPPSEAGALAAATLPPPGPDRVSAYLDDPSTGLLPDAVLTVSPYRARLGLTYLFSPEIAVGVNRFGTQLGGGVGAVFSDVLETHEVGIATVIQGSWRDAAAQAYYQNKKRRLRWSVMGGHIAYRADFAGYSLVPVEVAPGDTAYAEAYELLTQRIYFDQLGLGASYPLSTTRRLEAYVAGTHVSATAWSASS
jgi:Tol biopolymer transport system component